eukprot:TRINITY_DN35458_c0_g1_i1.p1 TRINITY_DN35458_c0_g1~~TRINITY_DN35458_c0_g1_i1.p1  ORF type:complete len:420 (-),score=62.03 TRINITY_DN35458_c0_g1_i1:531-1790(-)
MAAATFLHEGLVRSCHHAQGACFRGTGAMSSWSRSARQQVEGRCGTFVCARTSCRSNMVSLRPLASQRRALTRASSSTTVIQTELDLVSQLSEIVPDTVVGDDFERFPPTAATVSFSLLVGVSSLPDSKYEGAIDSALAYGKCLLEESGDNRTSCFLDKALVNVGAELSKSVPGRISTEVDARLAADTSAIVDKVRTLLRLYKEMEVRPDRVLFKIPATWQGIEAARQLEDDGIATHVTGVYSFAQAAACAAAKVSVIQIPVGRLRDWARTNSGDKDIDAAAAAGTDPGLDLVSRAAALVKQLGGKTKIMASNVRTKEDVLGLLGVDYIIAPVKILESLKETEVSKADGGNAKYEKKVGGDSAALSVSVDEAKDWDSAKFDRESGPCSRSLLASELEGSVAQSHRVEEYFAKIWPPPNV